MNFIKNAVLGSNFENCIFVYFNSFSHILSTLSFNLESSAPINVPSFFNPKLGVIAIISVHDS